MQAAQYFEVDEEGTRLAYLDSGAVPGDTYTTLVCVHGHMLHSPIFARLFPPAPSHNLRIIAVNRRDYVGSTPFSPAELSILHGKDGAAHEAFLRARGLEIARFLVKVIKEKKIPRARAHGKQGGLALLGWSMGNITTLSFLRHLKSYPTDIVAALEPYLTTFILHDPVYSHLGYSAPEGAWSPLTDPTLTQSEREALFVIWTTAYFDHPFYAKPGSQKEVQALAKHHSNVEGKTIALEAFGLEDLRGCVEVEPSTRSESGFTTEVSLQTRRDMLKGALQGSNIVLPNLKVYVLYGTRSIWSCIWAAWDLEKDVNNWEKEGQKHRPILFVEMVGDSHYNHWDDPHAFLGRVGREIRGSHVSKL